MMLRPCHILPAVLLASACTRPAPVDLSTWRSEGAGNWLLESRIAANDTVFQTENGDPGVFYDPVGRAQGSILAGTILVEEGGDDDFIGFVLGYTPGAIADENADFLLIDWKRADQEYNQLGQARAGLSVSRVRGPLTEAPGPWAHDPADNVTELARASSLARTGWEPGRSYAFKIRYTATELRVSVDGQEELLLSGDFPQGAFGFYNYSQPQVRYAGITTARVLPLPSWLVTIGLALILAVVIAVLLRRRRLRYKSGHPG